MIKDNIILGTDGTNYKIDIAGKEYTPQDIVTMILQKFKRNAEVYLGEKVSQAVIIVPTRI